MDWLKTLIDALALLRYNELQLYTEHTFAYAEHATVWEHASPMTAAEIREIDAYCSACGIELVPNQNSFAHLERWLRHDAYKHLAECPDGFEHPIAGWRTFGGTLAPTEESAAFIDTLYEEFLPNFTSKQLHIGCDEPWELGQGRSQERVGREGKAPALYGIPESPVRTGGKARAPGTVLGRHHFGAARSGAAVAKECDPSDLGL